MHNLVVLLVYSLDQVLIHNRTQFAKKRVLFVLMLSNNHHDWQHICKLNRKKIGKKNEFKIYLLNGYDWMTRDLL